MTKSKTMTPAQIEARLAEIEKEQAELSAVDYDALLTKAVVEGGDMDAIEQQQVESERRLRRLRIEREALTDLMPKARQAAVAPQVDKLVAEHSDLMRQAGESASAAVALWEQVVAELQRYSDIRTQSIELTNQVWDMARKVDLDAPGLGAPMSKKLQAAKREMERLGGQQDFPLSRASGHGIIQLGVSVDTEEAA